MNSKTLYRILLISVLAFTSKTYTMDNTTTAYLAAGSMVLGSCGYGVGYVANRLAVAQTQKLFRDELHWTGTTLANKETEIAKWITYKHNQAHTAWLSSWFVNSKYKGFPLIEALETVRTHHQRILWTLPFVCCFQSGSEARTLLGKLKKIETIILTNQDFTEQLRGFSQSQTAQTIQINR